MENNNTTDTKIDIESLRAFFQNDIFAMDQGIVIDDVTPTGATCHLLLTARHGNAAGVAQGGLVYTLADFTFAVAANGIHMGTVTLNSTISYLRAGTGTSLTARAELVSTTRSICVYRVHVTDDRDNLCAELTITGYRKPTPAK